MQTLQRRYDQQDGITERGKISAEYLAPSIVPSYVGTIDREMRRVFGEMAESGLYGNAPAYVVAFWESAKLGICDGVVKDSRKESFLFFVQPADLANWPELRRVDTVCIWRDLHTGEYGHDVKQSTRGVCPACGGTSAEDCKCLV